LNQGEGDFLPLHFIDKAQKDKSESPFMAGGQEDLPAAHGHNPPPTVRIAMIRTQNSTSPASPTSSSPVWDKKDIADDQRRTNSNDRPIISISTNPTVTDR
jgi:hypothetical protein